MVTQKKFSKLKKQLDRQSQLPFIVVSNSMMPLIRAGDLIVVAPLDSPPQRFNILVFLHDGLLIAHFLWHVNSRLKPDGKAVYITCGLSNWPGEDLPISEDQVLGRVVSHRISPSQRLKMIFHALLHGKM